MSRDIPTALGTDIDQPVVRPFMAVRIELPDPVYVWSGTGNIVFNDADSISRTWQGVGQLGGIEPVGEATDGSATGLKVVLYEAPADFRDDIADQATRGALMELYVGSMDTEFFNVNARHLLWKGRVDQYKITDAGATLSVEITGESRAIDQRRPSIKRFTDEYQQRKFAGDLFFQYVPQMTEVAILWAKAEIQTAGVGGGTRNISGVDGVSRQNIF